MDRCKIKVDLPFDHQNQSRFLSLLPDRQTGNIMPLFTAIDGTGFKHDIDQELEFLVFKQNTSITCLNPDSLQLKLCLQANSCQCTAIFFLRAASSEYI